jgi:hypothetical protein
MNKLSGEGLFDERPRTQTSLGRFVLWATLLSTRYSSSLYLKISESGTLASFFARWLPQTARSCVPHLSARL